MSLVPATVAAAFEESAARWADAPFLEVLPETAAAYGVAAGALTYYAAQQRIVALREADSSKAAATVAGTRLTQRPYMNNCMLLNAASQFTRSTRLRRMRNASSCRTSVCDVQPA